MLIFSLRHVCHFSKLYFPEKWCPPNVILYAKRRGRAPPAHALRSCPSCYQEYIVLPPILCHLSQELQLCQLFDGCKFWQKILDRAFSQFSFFLERMPVRVKYRIECSFDFKILLAFVFTKFG